MIAATDRFLTRAQIWFGRLSPWCARAVALLLGCIATLALPPLNVVPALAIALPGLFWLVDAALRRRDAFWLGGCFGLGHFSTGLYWIVYAYLVPPAQFAALGVPSVIGLAALLAIFVGLSMALYLWLAQRLGLQHRRAWRRVLLFAVCFVLFEWLRGHVLTGFPWNQMAHVWSFSDTFSQSAAVWGAYGLSLVTLLAFTLPAAGWRGIGGSVAILLVMAGGGALRLMGDDGAKQPGVYLRVVQPNVPQADKWLSRNVAPQFDDLLRLSTAPSDRPITVLIWPESATPFALARSPDFLAAIGRIAPKGGYVLTGAPRVTQDAQGKRRDYNSLHAIDDQGHVVADYDKFHLVPFGEYLPLRDLLPLEKTIGRGSFESGPGPRSIALPNLPAFSALICYEIIFPGAVVDESQRPAWIVNITNDAWFGYSSGPYQHLASARLRAIEEGLPLVRSANTGISAVIDAYGHVRAQLGLEKRGVIDEALPAALSPTPYSQFGDWIVFALVMTSICIALARFPRK
ncbi:MAG: apolipoprotein N-acyltransferase [Rhodospirillales bacterium]